MSHITFALTIVFLLFVGEDEQDFVEGSREGEWLSPKDLRWVRDMILPKDYLFRGKQRVFWWELNTIKPSFFFPCFFCERFPQYWEEKAQGVGGSVESNNLEQKHKLFIHKVWQCDQNVSKSIHNNNKNDWFTWVLRSPTLFCNVQPKHNHTQWSNIMSVLLIPPKLNGSFNDN